jgi:hypothetical protein
MFFSGKKPLRKDEVCENGEDSNDWGLLFFIPKTLIFSRFFDRVDIV